MIKTGVLGACAVLMLASLSPAQVFRLDGDQDLRCNGANARNALCQSVAQNHGPQAPFQSCINLGGALEANFEGEWGYRIEDAHLREIAAAGFEAIRVPIRWSAHAGESAPYTIAPEFFARIDHIIETALGEGLHVIINIHHFEAFMADPEGQAARLAAFWTQIAQHYRDQDDRVIFEILNEPYGAVDYDRVNQINADMLALIRRENPTRWVILSAGHWSHLEGLEAVIPPRDDRIMATFHYYDPFEFTHQGAPWTNVTRTGVWWGDEDDRAAIRADMDRAAQYARRHQVPVLMGEFGVYRGVPLGQRAQWTKFVRQSSEAEGLAWCHWDFATTFPIYNQDADSWIVPMRDSLFD
ncbi:glycoside hydrolase family 5 protein [Woodsholea maritima]|uniref:glycoside hydrolase family 5 protein n=1 Tax=Woodsholea maritima TaxID=240237 RepID=UPI0003734E14|nr:glycoside hydrolase family 5 protein [Woodsholea maritima]